MNTMAIRRRGIAISSSHLQSTVRFLAAAIDAISYLVLGGVFPGCSRPT
jgi:hypothetical protein